VLILDCCYSGMAVGAMSTGAIDVREVAVGGTAVITSSPPNKISLSPPGDRHTAFTGELITQPAQTVAPTKKIHLILDNGSSHPSKQTRTWLREHPRFTVTYTPTHASWLNMVEIFFSILTRRMLRRGDFTSRDDLIDKITTFIDTYNSTAKPFR